MNNVLDLINELTKEEEMPQKSPRLYAIPQKPTWLRKAIDWFSQKDPLNYSNGYFAKPTPSFPKTRLPKDYYNNNWHMNLKNELTNDPVRRTYHLFNKKTPPKPIYYGFDGNDLTQYQGTQCLDRWPAMSGHKNFQKAIYQYIPGLGPLPEGLYGFKKNEFQHFKDVSGVNRILGVAKRGTWPFLTPAWGQHRVDLKADEQTPMFNRSGITKHGGWFYGSGGCVDLAGQMDNFYNNLTKQNSQNVFPLFVKYDYDNPFRWKK